MRVWVLGSGSRGNSVVVEAAGSRIVIDAGFAPQVMTQRLQAAAIAPESVEALVLTHEHADHVRGARSMARKYGWTLLATPGTMMAARDLRDTVSLPLVIGNVACVGAFEVACARAPHDAAEPVVVSVTARASGARAAVVYDLGSPTTDVMALIRNLDVLVLEANHDEGMLREGPYPPSVRARIAGRHGHLSNRAAGELLCQVTHRQLRQVALAHLSESCNTAATALREVGAAVRRAPFAGRLAVAPQDTVVGPLEPGARRAAAVQLDFAL